VYLIQGLELWWVAFLGDPGTTAVADDLRRLKLSSLVASVRNPGTM
jgi:hypothetical protein